MKFFTAEHEEVIDGATRMWLLPSALALRARRPKTQTSGFFTAHQQKEICCEDVCYPLGALR